MVKINIRIVNDGEKLESTNKIMMKKYSDKNVKHT